MRGITHLFDHLVHGTNSDSEWLAFIGALALTHSMGQADIELIGDAIEVITKAIRTLNSGRSKHGTRHDSELVCWQAKSSQTLDQTREKSCRHSFDCTALKPMNL